MDARPTLTDVLAAVFALAESRRFNADKALFHGALYQAREACPWLESLGFTPPPGPRSVLLDIIVRLLEAYGTVSADADDALRMTDAARGRIARDVLSRFSEDELAGIKRAAAILDAACGIPAAEPSSSERQ